VQSQEKVNSDHIEDSYMLFETMSERALRREQCEKRRIIPSNSALMSINEREEMDEIQNYSAPMSITKREEMEEIMN
jgi:hypothetical protein